MNPMKTQMFAALVLCLIAPTSVHADSLVLVCTGKSYLSFERDGITSPPTESDAELVIELRGDQLIRGTKSAECVKTEREIRCSTSTPSYEHSSVFNRYSGRMVLREKLHSTTSAIFTANVRCSPAQPKF